jgi:hypothetical protein
MAIDKTKYEALSIFELRSLIASNASAVSEIIEDMDEAVDMENEEGFDEATAEALEAWETVGVIFTVLSKKMKAKLDE